MTEIDERLRFVALKKSVGIGQPFFLSQFADVIQEQSRGLSRKKSLDLAKGLLDAGENLRILLRLSKLRWVFPEPGRDAEHYRSMIIPSGRKGKTQRAVKQELVTVLESERWQRQRPGSRNCVQMSLASLLSRKHTEVPDFVADHSGEWESAMRHWLSNQGFNVLRLGRGATFSGFYLARGKTASGRSHMMIYRNGYPHWDPHPKGTGLVEVDAIFVLIPLDPARVRVS